MTTNPYQTPESDPEPIVKDTAQETMARETLGCGGSAIGFLLGPMIAWGLSRALETDLTRNSLARVLVVAIISSIVGAVIGYWLPSVSSRYRKDS